MPLMSSNARELQSCVVPASAFRVQRLLPQCHLLNLLLISVVANPNWEHNREGDAR